jgi:hypothetical protein
LNDEVFIRDITKLITKLKEEPMEDKMVFWEYMTFKIREYSIQYGKKRAKEQGGREEQYEKKLKKLVRKR